MDGSTNDKIAAASDNRQEQQQPTPTEGQRSVAGVANSKTESSGTIARAAVQTKSRPSTAAASAVAAAAAAAAAMPIPAPPVKIAASVSESPKKAATVTAMHPTAATSSAAGGAAAATNSNSNRRKRPAPSSTTSLHLTSVARVDKNGFLPSGKPPQSGTGAPEVAAATAASTTTPSPAPHAIARVGKDGAPLSEKKLRRLEKNRLSARECRRRKREATENMQGQINLLEGENLRLRLQLQVGEEAEQTNHQKQVDSTKALDELLKSGKASESEIYAKIEEYKEKFADYGRDRRSAMEFHLRNVERLLMPTQTTNFIMNTLKDSSVHSEPSPIETSFSSQNQGPVAVQSGWPNMGESTTTATPVSSSSTTTTTTTTMKQLPKTSKELFTLLVQQLEVTPAQAAALKDSRFVAQEMDETLKETLNVLKELRGRLARCGQDLETEFNSIRQILTPSQSAKFLVWVARNKACMHMLNELWSKNYPMEDNTTHATGTDAQGMVPRSVGSFDE